MPGVAPYLEKRLNRRNFFKLAAVVAVAASLGRRGLAQSPRGEVRPAYVADLRRAQYGRQRGRYPVARRG